MEIADLKQVIEASEYSANWEHILTEYYKYFNEIKEYFPKRFINHFNKNNHYHDWLLENISIINVNKGTRRPDFILQLSHGNSKVTMRFEDVVSLHIDGDYCFPSKTWTDFVCPILYWWQARLSEMIDNAKDSCELLFMDGDCSVTVHDHGETVTMDFIMKGRIERSIAGINKAELCSVVDEALKSLDIPPLNE